MIGSEEELFLFLITEFPLFSEWWSSDDNCNVLEDGGFSAAGLCAEFSIFYNENFKILSEPSKCHLFSKIECILSEEGGLANSIKACYLENIAQTEAGELSKKYMGPQARVFFNMWHIYP